MSYKRQPTTLIARQGYSGLGVDTSAPCAAGWVKNQYGYCIQAGTAPVPTQSFLSKAASAGLDLVKGLFGGSSTPTTPVVVQQSSTPEWLMPVAIGAAGLVAVMLIAKRKNPARRRHRR